MNKKRSITKLEARFMALQYAWAYVSEAAHSINSDFFEEFGSPQLLDESKLNDESYGCKSFIPTEAEKKVIMKELIRLDATLHKQMRKCRENFYKSKLP